MGQFYIIFFQNNNVQYPKTLKLPDGLRHEFEIIIAHDNISFRLTSHILAFKIGPVL